MVASGCFVLSTVLAASARQELDDKAATFLGADLAVTVLDPMEVPPWLDGRATVTVRVDAEADGKAVDLLGVDPAEFHRVARWRDDAADRPLADLVSALSPGAAAAGGRLPAVVVGAPSEWSEIDVVTSVGGTVVPVRETATARWFPGVRSERVLVVVDRELLLELVDASRRVIWVRDPAADTVDRLRGDGARVAAVVSRDEVFDGTSYRAQQWSFAPLGALGVLFAAVAAAVQLLVVEARGATRRAAHLVMRRTGFRGRDLWAAALVEVAVPFISAAAMGAGVAIVAARVSIRHLDPLPLVAPPARVVVPHAPLLALAVVTVLVLLLLAASAVRSTKRGDPMEVLRGTA